jgi:hypothetical protein
MPKASAGDPRARKRFRIEPKVICTVRTTIRAVPVGESNTAFAVMHSRLSDFRHGSSFSLQPEALRPRAVLRKLW